MKKSLIAVAVAGLFAAPVAMAEVTIGGTINVGPVYMKSSQPSDPASPRGISHTSLQANYSNLNISSTDDIGDGNKVIFNVQFDLGNLVNTGAFANRNSYLGLQGGWGTFKMGTDEVIYERYMYESDPIDGAMGVGGNIQMLGQSGLAGSNWFHFGNGDQTGGGNFEAGSMWRRTHQTLSYDSPNLDGLTFGIAQTLPFKTRDGTGAQALNPTITSLGVQYKPEGGPFFVNLAYQKNKDSLFGSNPLNDFPLGGVHADASGLQLGAGFNIADLTLYARAERLEFKFKTPDAGTFKRNHLWFGAKYSLPTGYLAAELGLAGKAKFSGTGDPTLDGDVPSSKATMISLAYFHNLSKHSQTYVAATRISNQDNANYGIDRGSSGGFGSDHTAFTVGLKHAF